MQETKRLFAAVKIQASETFLEVYDRIKQSLRNERITWVNPSNMHLTIKFFGDTFVHQIPDINKSLKIACQSTEKFSLEVRNTGMFGSRYDPRVIWFGIEAGENMQQLFSRVSEQLKTIGIFPDRQNFVPHLTIGRIKGLRDKISFQQVLEENRIHDSGSQEIEELIFYESILRREGPIYIPVHTYQFL
ncbi:MAG TPA: RNA 2',3'-cyclic phosphodiesterase [Bacteroidales bacterium]|nr:RNA 2',3'-cyclic phosphodiesterase [Bacteroidales bacterium]